MPLSPHIRTLAHAYELHDLVQDLATSWDYKRKTVTQKAPQRGCIVLTIMSIKNLIPTQQLINIEYYAIN